MCVPYPCAEMLIPVRNVFLCSVPGCAMHLMGPQKTIMQLMPIFVNKLKPQRVCQSFQQALARHSRHKFSNVLYIEPVCSGDGTAMTFEKF